MARKTPLKREPLVTLEDIRDDCVAVVLNSGQSFKRVHERGGPTAQTISKWLYKETMFPQLATVRAMLNACDHDLTIAPKGSVRIQRINPEGVEHVAMPPKAAPASRVSRLLQNKRTSAMIKGAGKGTQQRVKARVEARRSK